MQSPVKQDKAAITKLLQSDTAGVANCKKMVWKLQEENERLRESLGTLVQAIDEDSGPIVKSAANVIASRKLNNASAEHVVATIKEFAARAKQKQWGLENKVKRSECQIKTLAIDSKTREQVRFRSEAEVAVDKGHHGGE